MLKPGQVESGFRLDEVLGEDNLAATWKATSVGTGQVRILRVLTVQQEAFQERFFRSASAQIDIHHPNLVRVLGLIQIGDMPAAVTDFVDGPDLGTWIKGPRPLTEGLGIFVGLTRGLAAAHAAGLLHRNLKPSKILLASSIEGPMPKINDFTLGKVTADNGPALTQLGTTFGTPQYMSPEQFRGVGDVDPRSDLFALGCIFYEMMCGTRAFHGASVIELYKSVSQARYQPLLELRPDLPAEVVALTARLLAPKLDDRPQSAQEALDELRGYEALLPLLPSSAKVPTLVPAGPTLVTTNSGATPMSVSEDAAPRRVAPLGPVEPEPTGTRGAPPPVPDKLQVIAPAAPPLAGRSDPVPTQVPDTLPPSAAEQHQEQTLMRQIRVAALVALVLLAIVALLLVWAFG